MASEWSLAFYLLVVVPAATCSLVVYPAADGAPSSDKFQIYLTQDGQRKQSHVYITTSDNRAAETSSVKGGRSMSWTSFAFTGTKVTVEVHTARDFQHCIVRPQSYGYSCLRSGTKTATFDVTATARTMSVEFDSDYGSDSGGADITDKLMVFADPPETSQPSKTDTSVLYYDVGIHNLNGQLTLDSHIKEVYLAPGAWVKGGFKSSAVAGLKIHGRGVLDNKDYRFHDSRFSLAAINLDTGSRHVVEGITISDPCCNSVRAHSAMNTLNNVKIVGAWAPNNGGVSVGLDGLVEQSFIHANGDAILLYGNNLRVTHCVVWQAQNGAVLQTGGSESHTVHNVLVDNLDVIHTDWCTFKGRSCSLSDNEAIFNNAGDARTVDASDMILRNVRVEGSCPRVFYWKVNPGASATLRNIRFSSWSIETQPTHDNIHNEFAGSGSTGHVSGLQFVDLRINGRCVASLAEADLLIDSPTTTNLIFDCGGSIVG